MPFDRVEELSREVNALQRHVHKIMSREIVREKQCDAALGSMRAEERLAAFLHESGATPARARLLPA